ncbi:MAG: GNAT family N-acetyltransferase [Gammaproteobacteria bacterium]|nr:GNAT family N-acetyltransferase [Gammaproteobacteria bacterium]
MEFRVTEADWRVRETDLMAVRNAVFVDEQGVPPELESDGRDAEATHFLATNEAGNPVGTARLLADGQIGRIAVLPEFRRRGLARRLLGLAMDSARARGDRRVWLHAQHDATDLYLQAGFRFVGERFIEAGISHIGMERDLG